MARPRIFISSTFYDLKHIRSSLESFIEVFGYEPILSEKGNIAYDPNIPLDESCYREAKTCDVFVIIIGGRYGSAASGQEGSVPRGFYDRYESITKKEYEAAVERDIPVYILIDRSVYTEYETFGKNRDNKGIRYAHVDSVNVFNLIDQIMAQPRNNPIHLFERHSEIEIWLREQWAGLFKEMISRRTSQKQISSLAIQVKELANISTTFKRYLEEIVSRVVAKKTTAEKIIKSEDERFEEVRRLEEFKNNPVIADLMFGFNLSFEAIHDMFTKAKSMNHFAQMMVEKIPDGQKYASSIVDVWHRNPYYAQEIQKLRQLLGLPDLKFEEDEQDKTPPKRKLIRIRRSKKPQEETR